MQRAGLPFDCPRAPKSRRGDALPQSAPGRPSMIPIRNSLAPARAQSLDRCRRRVLANEVRQHLPQLLLAAVADHGSHRLVDQEGEGVAHPVITALSAPPQVPDDLDVHLIMDNYATHKTATVRRWLASHLPWHVHFTPTGASSLNQVERFSRC